MEARVFQCRFHPDGRLSERGAVATGFSTDTYNSPLQLAVLDKVKGWTPS